MKAFYQKYKKAIKLILSVILSAVILFLLYRQINFSDLWEVFQSANPYAFAGFLLLFIPQLFIASYRWNFMSRDLGGLKISWYQSFQQVVGSYSANLLIPGKMGEFVRVAWMRKLQSDCPVLLLVFIEKLLDVIGVFTILFLSLLAVSLTDTIREPFLTAGITISIVFFAALLVIFLFSKYVFRFIDRRFEEKLARKSEEFFYFKLKKAIQLISRNLFAYSSQSILLWVVQIAEFYLIFLMFDLVLPVFQVSLGCSLALLAGAIPVSISGLGIRDAVIVDYFEAFASMETLVAIGMVTFLRVLIPSFVGLPFFFLQSRK